MSDEPEHHTLVVLPPVPLPPVPPPDPAAWWQWDARQWLPLRGPIR